MLAGVLLALTPACRCGPAVTSVEGELVVEPEGLVFAETWVGFPSTKTLTLTSRTRAPVEVTLEASPSVFSVEPASLTVGGGASVDVVVLHWYCQPHHVQVQPHDDVVVLSVCPVIAV